MEENHEKKFVCKFCSKRFSCGKALGGHIRTHMNDKSAEAGQEEAKVNRGKIPLSNNNGSSSKRDSGFEAAGQSGYGLRENPKKTRRFADSSNIAFHQEMVCKECGKGFQSLKALCGHMACHSEKEKVTNYKCEDHLGTNEKQKLVMDSQSDTETSTPSRRRSRRMRYKTGGLFSNSVSLANGSSCVSEIEQEQEEVAMCLMMLSRDSSFKKGLHSVADSSDNNSVVLEAKSSSIDVRITIKNGLHCVSGTGKSSEMKKQREGQKLKSAENNLSSSDNSDSGYFRNGPKKVESDVSVDGFVRNVESIKPEVLGSGFEDLKAKLGKNLSKFKSVTEFGKDLVGGQADRASAKYDLRKSKRNESCTPKFCSNNALKKSKINRALGGYGGSHSKTDGYESGENSLETESFVDPTVPGSRIAETSGGKNPTQHRLSGNPNKKSSSKKSKGHECPICFRMFKSGQALGGHKRSHFVGGQEDNTVVIKEELDEMPGLIDLNLPAPVEEEAMEHTGLVPW